MKLGLAADPFQGIQASSRLSLGRVLAAMQPPRAEGWPSHPSVAQLNGDGEVGPEPSFVVEQRVVSDEERVGRNDPCPCGSGKKYKKCHGAAV